MERQGGCDALETAGLLVRRKRICPCDASEAFFGNRYRLRVPCAAQRYGWIRKRNPGFRRGPGVDRSR